MQHDSRGMRRAELSGPRAVFVQADGAACCGWIAMRSTSSLVKLTRLGSRKGCLVVLTGKAFGFTVLMRAQLT